MRTIFAALTFAAFSLASPSARAEVTVDAAPEVSGCPSGAEITRWVAGQLERDPFSDPKTPAMRVSIVARDGGGLEARISRGAAIERTLVEPGGDCETLGRAVALALALAIERDAEARPSPAKPPSAPPPNAPPPIEGAEAVRPGRPRVVLGARAITSVGLLPHPATGVAVDARYHVTGATYATLLASFTPEARTSDDAFGARLFFGGVGACYEPFALHVLTAGFCAHLVGGALDVVNPTVAVDGTGAHPFAAATASAEARLHIVGPVDGVLDTAAVFPFVHDIIVTRDCPRRGFQESFGAFAVSLGAAATF